jgi:F-type H+-transporting ATPase subunit delta
LADLEKSGVAYRYAQALFDLASEQGQSAAVEEHVRTLRGLIAASPDLKRLLASPVISAEDQVRAIAAVLARMQIDGLAANLVKLAAKNRRAFVVPDMLKAYALLAAKSRGEKVAVVTSAEPLSAAQTAALTEALAAKAGGTVTLETHVDPSLIGGLVVKLGSQMIDTSVRTRLAALRQAMKEAA